MRVRLQTSGGIAFFPGLATPRTVDVDTLDGKTRETLAQLIRDADFFNLAPQPPARPGAADHYTYRITIEDGSRRHTVTVSEPVTDPGLHHLIELLRSLS
jgi:hypothetical protein